MTAFIHSDYLDPASSKVFPDPYESILMECGRLIHAAVISKRFLNSLLANPIKTIENGFCGEKFSFSHEEKQHIQLIQATTLAEFSNLLVQAVKQSYCIATAPEMAYVPLETNKER
jgi:hypothetical protein